MIQLKFLPPEIARQSISLKEIVLPFDAALEMIEYCVCNGIHILGWEGWIQYENGQVGHDNEQQGTSSLEYLSIPDAAEFCRRTIWTAALEWSASNHQQTDRLYFCVTINTDTLY